ncbi:hypothetical protein PybrP1_010370 [[Pythium] brassicae (nom. inval.)]|nr:hypothetical protein PybrP1_010370 [[Pythium] brassicae (nom. inval.)]
MSDGKRKRARGAGVRTDAALPSAALLVPKQPKSAEETQQDANADGDEEAEEKQWACPACTFLNDSLRAFCEMCGTSNPTPPAVAAADAKGPWSCVACTVTNPPGLRVCAVCGTINPHAPLHPALSIAHRGFSGGLLTGAMRHDMSDDEDDDDEDDDSEDDDDDGDDDDEDNNDDDDESQHALGARRRASKDNLGEESSASTWTCHVCSSDAPLPAIEKACPACFSARRKSPLKAPRGGAKRRTKSPSKPKPKPKRSAYGVSSDVLRKLALEPASSKLTDTLQTLTHTLAMLDASTDAEWGDMRGASLFIRGFGASSLTAAGGGAKDPALLEVLGEIFSQRERGYSLEVRLLAVQSINYLLKMDRHLFGRAEVLSVVGLYLNDLFAHTWDAAAAAHDDASKTSRSNNNNNSRGAGSGPSACRSAQMVVEECLTGMASVCNFESYALRELVRSDSFDKYLDFVARLVAHESGFHASIVVTSLDLLQKCCVRMRWSAGGAVGSGAAIASAPTSDAKRLKKLSKKKVKPSDAATTATVATTVSPLSAAKQEGVMTMGLAKKVVALLRRTLAHKHVALHVKAARCLLVVFHRVPYQPSQAILELATDDLLAELVAVVANVSGDESEDSRQAVAMLLIQLFDNRPQLVSVFVQKRIYNLLFDGVLPLLRSTTSSSLGAVTLKLTALLARLVCRKHSLAGATATEPAAPTSVDGEPRSQNRSRLNSAPDPDVLATLLLDFIRADSIPAVSALLKDGADLNFPRLVDVQGQEIDKPLQVAAAYASLAMVKYLVKRGADVHQSGPGGTALHVAAKCGRCDVVSFLLQCGASVTLLDRSGKTVLQLVDSLAEGDAAAAFPSPVKKLLEIHRRACHAGGEASDHSEDGERRHSRAEARAWFFADDDDNDDDDDDDEHDDDDEELDDEDDDEEGYYLAECDDDDDDDDDNGGDGGYRHYRDGRAAFKDDDELSSADEDDEQKGSKQKLDDEEAKERDHDAARKEDDALLRRRGFTASPEEIYAFSQAILQCLLSVLYDLDIQNVERSVIATLACVLEMAPSQLVRSLSDRDVVLVLDMVHFLLQGRKLDPHQQTLKPPPTGAAASELSANAPPSSLASSAGNQLKANLSAYILALRILQAVVRKSSADSSIFYQIERRGICEQIEQLNAESGDWMSPSASAQTEDALAATSASPAPRDTIFKRGLELLDALRANMIESGMLHLHKLKNLARRMRAIDEDSTVEERELAVVDLVELFEHPNSITTYEFKQSELLPAVLHFVAPGRQVNESRVRLLMRAFASCSEGLKHLVFRLQNIITHEESFRVVSYNPGKGRELYPLTRQLKISFSRVRPSSDKQPTDTVGDDNDDDWTGVRAADALTTKTIHSSPLTHFQSFERTIARCLPVHDAKLAQLYVNLVGHSIQKVVDGKWKKFWVCGYDATRSFHLLKPIGEGADELVEMVLHDSQYKLTGAVDVYRAVRVDLELFGSVVSDGTAKDGKKKRKATNKRKRKLSSSKSHTDDSEWKALCDVEVRNDSDLNVGRLHGAWYAGSLVVDAAAGSDGKAKPGSAKAGSFEGLVKAHGSYSVRVEPGQKVVHKVPAAALRKRLSAPQVGSVVEVDGALGEVTKVHPRERDGRDAVDVKMSGDVAKVRVKKDRVRFPPPSAPPASDPETAAIEAMSIRRMFPARESSVLAGCVGDRVWVSPPPGSRVKDLCVAGTITSFPSGLESIREASTVYVAVSFGLDAQPPVTIKVQQDHVVNFARRGGNGSRLLAALQMASGRAAGHPHDGLFGGGHADSAFRQVFQQMAGPLRPELSGSGGARLSGSGTGSTMSQIRQLISRSALGGDAFDGVARDAPLQAAGITAVPSALSASVASASAGADGPAAEADVTLAIEAPSASPSRTSSPVVSKRATALGKRPSEGSASTQNENAVAFLQREGEAPEWVCAFAPKVNLRLAFNGRESSDVQLDAAIANSRVGGAASKSASTPEDKKVRSLLFCKPHDAEITELKPAVKAVLLEIFKTFETVAPRVPAPKKKKRKVSLPPVPAAADLSAASVASSATPWDVDRFCAFMTRCVGWPMPAFRSGADGSCVEQCILFSKFATAASARRGLDATGFLKLMASFCRETWKAKLVVKHLQALGYSEAALSAAAAVLRDGMAMKKVAAAVGVRPGSSADMDAPAATANAPSTSAAHQVALMGFPADQNVLKCLQILQENASAAVASGGTSSSVSVVPPWKYLYKVLCDFAVDWTTDASHSSSSSGPPSGSSAALGSSSVEQKPKKRKLSAKRPAIRGLVGDRVQLRLTGAGDDAGAAEDLDDFVWLDESTTDGSRRSSSSSSSSSLPSAICLLLCLYDYNGSGSGAVVREDVWTSPRLYNKLEEQLQDVLSVCSGIYPAWCDRMVTQCRFFFPRELRERLFRATAFGCTRSLHWFRSQLQVEEGGDSAGLGGGGGGGILNQEISITPIPKERVKVQRANILGSAEAVMKMHAKRRAILDIVFAGEKGYGSGVTAAFYSATALALQTVDENRRHRLWVSGDESERASSVCGQKTTLATDDSNGDATDDDDVIRHPNGLFPFPHASAPAKVVERFRMMGRLAGKALMDERLLPLPLSPHFMQLVVGESFAVDEVAAIFQGPGKILLAMRAAAQQLADGAAASAVQIDGLALDAWLDAVAFTFIEPLSQKPLRPGGDDVAVTAANLREYVESVLSVWLAHGIEAQVRAFRDGIAEVLPLAKLQLLFVPELLSLLCGDADIAWDVESLRRTLKLAHGYTDASAPVQFFAEFLDEMSVAERRAFLLYATGCPNLPPGGFPALRPAFEVVRRVVETDDVDRALPFARTCTNTLHLPAYSSKDVLVRQMRFAIANSRGVIDRD